MAAATGIGGDDLAEMLPSGKATVFGSRVGWALTYMSQAGLATRPKRGVYLIADRGRTVLDEHPERVDNKVLEQFPEFLEFRARRNEKGEPVGTHGEPSTVSVSALSPTEAIERLVSDADDAVAAELLDRVLAQPPAFLELLSLRLLRAMGYGGREALLTHTGKPGDRGLDGIIRQDALGLDLVGVQAKRYDRDAAVQRPEMQAFVGALQGAQTSRGVFVTTGRFSAGARQFAEQVVDVLGTGCDPSSCGLASGRARVRPRAPTNAYPAPSGRHQVQPEELGLDGVVDPVDSCPARRRVGVSTSTDRPTASRPIVAMRAGW